MKKLTLITAVALVALLFTSCRKEDYKSFIGTWGVEKIEYYNLDYAGNPIAGSFETYTFDPESTDNGIQLYFRKDKTGEMRDSAVDTIWIEDEETGENTSYIYCPDTVLIYQFTYSYDKSDHSLYMNMLDIARPYRLQVENLTDNSFMYENEYFMDYVEKSYLKRISKTADKAEKRQSAAHPHKPGAFIGGR